MESCPSGLWCMIGNHVYGELVVPRIQIPCSPPALDGALAVSCNLQTAIVGLNFQFRLNFWRQRLTSGVEKGVPCNRRL